MSYDDNRPDVNKDWNELSLKQYSGFDINPYEAYLVSPYALVFMTRPKLFIKTSNSSSGDLLEEMAYKNMKNHPYLSRFTSENVQNSKDKLVADFLSFSKDSSTADINHVNFIPLFTNKTKNFSVEMNSISMGEQGATRHGFRHVYPTHNVSSLANGIISIELHEMKDLEVSNLIGIWYNTILGIVNGELRANPSMIKENRLDYVSTLYYFRLDKDAKTIRYWSKYTGVFPNINPSDTFSWQASQVTMFPMNASFSYDSREELTFSILDDFNNTSIGRSDYVSTSSGSDNSEFNINLLSKKNVFEKADNLLNKVPLIYYEEDKESSNKSRSNKRIVLKLGNDAVYKSPSELLSDVINDEDTIDMVGSLGNRRRLYEQSEE